VTTNRILLYRLGWLAAAVMIGVGAALPFFTFSKFFFFDDTFSLFSGIFHLLTAGEPVLFALVFLFSILLPVYKMFVLFRLINHRAMEESVRRRHTTMLMFLGKWSMLDVFVVAMLIMTVKLGAIASVKVHGGLYLFSAGVLASMLLTHLVARKQAVNEALS
jgi:paraquat-inducible protein A